MNPTYGGFRGKEGLMKEHKDFTTIKCIVSNAICRVVSFCEAKIEPQHLNDMANNYTDKIIASLSQKKWCEHNRNIAGEYHRCFICNPQEKSPKITLLQIPENSQTFIFPQDWRVLLKKVNELIKAHNERKG